LVKTNTRRGIALSVWQTFQEIGSALAPSAAAQVTEMIDAK
jgi:hypothetical protein